MKQFLIDCLLGTLLGMAVMAAAFLVLITAKDARGAEPGQEMTVTAGCGDEEYAL